MSALKPRNAQGRDARQIARGFWMKVRPFRGHKDGMKRPLPFRALALSAVTTALAACGAKTGLRLPDVVTTPDATLDASDVADVMDVADVRDVVRGCVPGRFNLEARAADILLVIDRSGSMGQSLSGSRTSKWRVVRDALNATLPQFQRQIQVGAVFYPEEGADTRTAACAFANIPSVDITPAFNTTSRVVGIFDNTAPGGATPTNAALLRGYTYFVRNPNRARARYLVLATDGAPNCNAGLNPTTCVCVRPGGRGGACSSDGNNCLDDARTVATIRQIAVNPVTPIPTYVIGIAGSDDVAFSQTLTAMAVAGGRPNRTATGEATFYDVQREGDLTRAFTSIQSAIARCTFVAPSRPSDTDTITLTVNGVPVPRDTTHVNGWDWTDRAVGELTLFGAACPADVSPSTNATATVECRPDAG